MIAAAVKQGGQIGQLPLLDQGQIGDDPAPRALDRQAGLFNPPIEPGAPPGDAVNQPGDRPAVFGTDVAPGPEETTR